MNYSSEIHGIKVSFLFLTFVVPLIVTWLILPRLAKIAPKVGMLDVPNKRKMHLVPKPRVGGVGMLAGFSAAAFLFLPFSHLKGYCAGLFLLGVAGLVDDMRELSHRVKFALQIAAVLLMVYLDGVVLHSFGNLFGMGDISLGIFSVPVTLFCAVGVINAINMADGLDGLAGGISLIALVVFALLSYSTGHPDLMLLSAAMAGAVIGFLRYNWQPSKLFMGDTGSMMLGFTLAYLSVAVTQTANSIVPPVAALLVLAIPITDTLTVMMKRAWYGKNPFRPDRYHLHHILLRFGIEKDDSVSVLITQTLVFAVGALLGSLLAIPDSYLFAAFSLYFISYFVVSFHLKKLVRLKVRLMKRVSESPKRRYQRRPSGETISFVPRDMDFADSRKVAGKLVNICDGGFCMCTDCPLERGHTISVVGNGNGNGGNGNGNGNGKKKASMEGRVLWTRRINGNYMVGVTYRKLTY